MIEVVILSPTPALRAGLRALLTGDPDMHVAAAAGRLGMDAGDLTEIPPETDVIVVTPGGVDLSTGWPQLVSERCTALLLITADAQEAAALASTLPAPPSLDWQEPGGGCAWGVLSPEATAEALQSAVRALSEGLVAVSPELLRHLAAAIERPAADQSLTGAGKTRPGEPGAARYGSAPPDGEEEILVDHLTGRESDVLRLLAQGLTNKQIALALQISEHTVKFHVSSIYSKLGASNRTDAVRKGARRGWVPL